MAKTLREWKQHEDGSISTPMPGWRNSDRVTIDRNPAITHRTSYRATVGTGDPTKPRVLVRDEVSIDAVKRKLARYHDIKKYVE